MRRDRPKASRQRPANARFSELTGLTVGLGEIAQYFEPVVLLGRA
jgi:hypothetical protein